VLDYSSQGRKSIIQKQNKKTRKLYLRKKLQRKKLRRNKMKLVNNLGRIRRDRIRKLRRLGR
jgi:hypothetical protein